LWWCAPGVYLVRIVDRSFALPYDATTRAAAVKTYGPRTDAAIEAYDQVVKAALGFNLGFRRQGVINFLDPLEFLVGLKNQLLKGGFLGKVFDDVALKPESARFLLPIGSVR